MADFIKQFRGGIYFAIGHFEVIFAEVQKSKKLEKKEGNVKKKPHVWSMNGFFKRIFTGKYLIGFVKQLEQKINLI